MQETTLVAVGGTNLLSGLSIAVLQMAPILVVFGVLYYFYLRPIRRQYRSHQRMLEKLEAGNPVVLESGIYGHVLAMHENDSVLLALGEDVTVPVTRSAIAKVISQEELAAARTPIPKSDD